MKDVTSYTDEKLASMLDFAERLTKMPDGTRKPLPRHLQEEKDRILEEVNRRLHKSNETATERPLMGTGVVTRHMMLD